MTSDTARLKFLMENGGVEGFVGIEKDRYEYACEVALEEGREEPNESDNLEGFRRLIDSAMALPNIVLDRHWRPNAPTLSGER